MQRQAKLRMLDEGEEAERAVVHPFNQQRVGISGDDGLDETGPFAQAPHIVSAGREGKPIGIPRCGHRFDRIVKDVHIARQAMRANRDAEGDAARDVAVSAGAAARG